MKIATWNVNGIRAREAQLLDFIAQERPDVLCLQEVKASPDQVPETLRAFPGYWTYWHGHKGYSGVALFLGKDRFPDAPVFTHPEFDHEHRIAVAEAGEQRFVSMYVPNGGKDFPAKVRFLEAMEGYVRDQHRQGLRLVLCGDLNVALEPRDVHERLRDEAQIGQTPGERALLRSVLAQGLTDLGRRFAPDDDGLFTWWAPWRNMRQRNMGWRLDYVLTSPYGAERATGCRTLRELGTSDHAPVVAELRDGA